MHFYSAFYTTVVLGPIISPFPPLFSWFRLGFIQVAEVLATKGHFCNREPNITPNVQSLILTFLRILLKCPHKS